MNSKAMKKMNDFYQSTYTNNFPPETYNLTFSSLHFRFSPENNIPAFAFMPHDATRMKIASEFQLFYPKKKGIKENEVINEPPMMKNKQIARPKSRNKSVSYSESTRTSKSATASPKNKHYVKTFKGGGTSKLLGCLTERFLSQIKEEAVNKIPIKKYDQLYNSKSKKQMNKEEEEANRKKPKINRNMSSPLNWNLSQRSLSCHSNNIPPQGFHTARPSHNQNPPTIPKPQIPTNLKTDIPPLQDQKSSSSFKLESNPFQHNRQEELDKRKNRALHGRVLTEPKAKPVPNNTSPKSIDSRANRGSKERRANRELDRKSVNKEKMYRNNTLACDLHSQNQYCGKDAPNNGSCSEYYTNYYNYAHDEKEQDNQYPIASNTRVALLIGHSNTNSTTNVHLHQKSNSFLFMLVHVYLYAYWNL